jgi:hypothetical protein
MTEVLQSPIPANPLPTKDLAHIYRLAIRIGRDEHSALSPLPAMTERDHHL